MLNNKQRRGWGRRAPANSARARGRARDYPEESPPRGGQRRYGQIRVKISGSKIVVWNNAEGPLVIEPGQAVVLQIIERWVKELDYARVVGYEARVLNEAVAPRRTSNEEIIDAGDINGYEMVKEFEEREARRMARKKRIEEVSDSDYDWV